ncbi:hypothetical protein RZR97_09770 [Hydrogenimonas thermophila]|uniref:hypothetical protein n=1 Tax=Hydrogenimonas thermophila TaxID=223786 RepID=UPI0029373C2A|nr:hypothetical protein [Hydrogenimonas thermophila]WOE69393.1 hypothetical protein RZR91_09795 [Hydrogenimonas thermophila]WOE71903.1 hypothetical protein RZR97_09770 [Hydrogenimonas thermophila]
MRYITPAIFSSVTAILLLSGCGNSNTTTEDLFATKSTSVAYPVLDKEKRSIQVAKSIQLEQTPNTVRSLEYKTILRTGQELNGETFGLLKDENDQPMTEEDGSQYICNGQYGGSGPDHT